MTTLRLPGAAQQWATGLSDYLIHPLNILRGYQRSDFRPDLIAGLTVGVVMLPQAIAYALIAELPPQTGLYAAIVASIVGALWGSSVHLNTGPTNAASLLVLATLLPIAVPGTPEYVAAAGLMAVMVGVIRLVMGLARLGVLVNFVSDSVIIGFTAGAGILISVNQLRHLLRLDIPSMPGFFDTLVAIAVNVGTTHWPSLLIGSGTILVIVILKRFWPKLPGPLIGMVIAAAMVGFLHLDRLGVIVLGGLPRSLPPLSSLPLTDFDLMGQMLSGAMAVAAIGLIEAISIARSIASQSGQRLDSDQEFIGQGLSNIATGFLSGYTCSGSFTRSAVNYAAGGRTALSSIFSALVVLGALLVFAPYAAFLPRSALAGVLIVTAYGMIDRKEMVRIWQASRGDSGIMIATIIATLVLPLQYAVLAGIVVSVIRFMLQTSTPAVHPVVPSDDFRHFVQIEEEKPVCPQLGVISVSGALYFGATHHVENVIRQNLEIHPEQQFLLLRMHLVDHCDVSGIHMLEAIVRLYRQRRGDVFLSGLRTQVREQMTSIGFDQILGADHFLGRHDAVSYLFHNVINPPICIYECEVRVFAECQALPKQPYALQQAEILNLPDYDIETWRPSVLRDELQYRSLLLVDVREGAEYRRGHIAEAISIPLSTLRRQSDLINKDQPVVLICRIGRRSRLAACILKDMGYDQVFNLQGGILAWEAAGYPLAVE